MAGIVSECRPESLRIRWPKSSECALYLFGSVVRGEAGPGSDVDILVEFEPDAHVGLFEFARLQRFLTERLGRPVDLATPDSLHKAFREGVLKEAVRAA